MCSAGVRQVCVKTFPEAGTERFDMALALALQAGSWRVKGGMVAGTRA